MVRTCRSYLVGGKGILRLLAIAGVVMSAGCGEITTTPAAVPAAAPAATPAATPAAAPAATPAAAPDVSTKNGGDDLDLSLVTTFILPSTPGVSPATVRGAKVTAKINSASTDGNNLRTSYDRYSFPSSDGTDAVCYFFYEYNGTVMGGKFDWWRTGGQSVKTMENVHHGYGGHRMPSPGTKCWTMFSSKDGKQRSNTCKVTWE